MQLRYSECVFLMLFLRCIAVHALKTSLDEPRDEKSPRDWLHIKQQVVDGNTYRRYEAAIGAANEEDYQ